MGGVMWIPVHVPWVVLPRFFHDPSRPSWLLGGTLRLSLLLTLERAVTRTAHLGVSLHIPSDKDIHLRDYRPMLGVAGRDLCWSKALAPTEFPAEMPNMERQCRR